jgi:hypothetical protein
LPEITRSSAADGSARRSKNARAVADPDEGIRELVHRQRLLGGLPRAAVRSERELAACFYCSTFDGSGRYGNENVWYRSSHLHFCLKLRVSSFSRYTAKFDRDVENRIGGGI